MFACKFDFLEPATLDEALDALAEDGAVAVDVKIILEKA